MTRIEKHTPISRTAAAAAAATPAKAASAAVVKTQKTLADSFERAAGNPLGRLLGGALARVDEARQARPLAQLAHADELVRGIGSPERSTDPRGAGAGQLGERGDGSPGGRAAAAAEGQQGSKGATGFANPLGRWAPDLPSNADNGPPSLVGRPSANPRDWASGLTGQDSTGKLPTTPDITITRDLETGTEERTTTSYDDKGEHVGTHQESRHADGSSSSLSAMRNADGSWSVSRTHRDRDGNVTDSTSWHFTPRDLQRLLDAGSAPVDPRLAAAVAHYDHSARQGAPVVVHVNPGPEGGTTEPQAPRLEPDEGLVVNPPPDEASQQREVDAETARRLRDTIERPNQVNPPGPGEE